MCGIAGIHAYHYAANPVDKIELLRIRDHMRLRGPDGSGEWVDRSGRIGLAHRRLSIIDLNERAAQPMCTADGQVVISFNGEIYNYRELRAQLVECGYVFHTESDTEVLLQLYVAKGEAMFAELRGMYAFALWDARQQATLLARDPYGIKPLYYADDGWTCRFASQVKALVAGGRISRACEPAAQAGFFLFGSVPEPFTMYQQIRAVPAGSFVWVDELGPSAPKQHFDIAAVWRKAAESPFASGESAIASVRTALQDSVRAHMVADVPVGAFLSAGIDSGSLVGLMRDAGAQDIRTVTLAFNEFSNTPQDEAPLAKVVAQHYGVDHRIRQVDEAEFNRDLPAILAAMDQPSIDGINTWFVGKAAHEAGLKVAVSGVGGDELFGGYPSFHDIPRWTRRLWLAAMIPGAGRVMEVLTGAFAPFFSGLNPKAAGMLRYGGSHAGGYLLKRGLLLPAELPALLGREQAAEGLHRLRPLKQLQHALAPLESTHSFARIAMLESTFYLRNQLLRDTDWASMAHSLEVRTPLVDSTLLQSIAPLLATGHGNKHWLAKSPALPLPAEISERSKTGFTTPVARWQQRSDKTVSWKTSAMLQQPFCPWARRWAKVVFDAR